VQQVSAAVAQLGVARCEVQLEAIASPGGHTLALPVLSSRGWFATLLCTADEAFPPAMERKLGLIAMSLSVWCAEHSLGAEQPGAELTPRQYEIAMLAACGHTNAEIAEQLGISINTVKVRLKQAFERLDVNNRTELANVLRSWAEDPSTMALSHKPRRA